MFDQNGVTPAGGNAAHGPQVTVQHVPAQQGFELTVRERFGLKPTVVFVPYGVVSFMMYQLLALQLAPTLAQIEAAQSQHGLVRPQ